MSRRARTRGDKRSMWVEAANVPAIEIPPPLTSEQAAIREILAPVQQEVEALRAEVARLNGLLAQQQQPTRAPGAEIED